MFVPVKAIRLVVGVRGLALLYGHHVIGVRAIFYRAEKIYIVYLNKLQIKSLTSLNIFNSQIEQLGFWGFGVLGFWGLLWTTGYYW